MVLSAKDMKVFSFQVLCRELLTIGRILMFFNNRNGIAKNKHEKSWKEEFVTLEDIEALEEKLRLMRAVAVNLRAEIAFSASK